MNKDHSFASNRLTYRGISKEDAPLIVGWRSDPENYRFFLNPHPISLEDHLQWFERYLQDDSRYDFMILNPAGEPIGTAGLSRVDDGTYEASYMIGDVSKRGCGYAKEALQAMVDLAVSQFAARRVLARILPFNEVSMHVAKACGFMEVERVYCKELID